MVNCSMWVLGLLFLGLISSPVRGVIEFGDALSKLIPCEPFVLMASPTPSDECCSGAKALDKIAATSKPDRKALCECLKLAGRSFPIDYGRVNQLPKLCKLTIKLNWTPILTATRSNGWWRFSGSKHRLLSGKKVDV